jgi:hypothetical protein
MLSPSISKSFTNFSGQEPNLVSLEANINLLNPKNNDIKSSSKIKNKKKIDTSVEIYFKKTIIRIGYV